MKLVDSIIYNTIEFNKQIGHLSNIKEVAAFLKGTLSISSRFPYLEEKGENFWIFNFEEYMINQVVKKVKNTPKDPNGLDGGIGTSYANWIYTIQKNDKDGLNILYRNFEKYSLQYIDG